MASLEFILYCVESVSFRPRKTTNFFMFFSTAKKYQAKKKKNDWESSTESLRLTGSITEQEGFKIMMVTACKLAPFLWDTELGNNFRTCFLPWLFFQTPLLLFVSVCFSYPVRRWDTRVAKTVLSISVIIWSAWKRTLFTKTEDCKWSLSYLCRC